jgi:ribonuclease HI
MASKNCNNTLTKVYVDASPQGRAQPGGDWGVLLVYLIANHLPKQFKYDTSLNYLGRRIETDEAEFLAIIFALSNVPGNLTVYCDNKQVVKDLQQGKITSKNSDFLQKIRELTRERVVEFQWIERNKNPAGRHLQGK